jgi:hypothetical protein
MTYEVASPGNPTIARWMLLRAVCGGAGTPCDVVRGRQVRDNPGGSAA